MVVERGDRSMNAPRCQESHPQGFLGAGFADTAGNSNNIALAAFAGCRSDPFKAFQNILDLDAWQRTIVGPISSGLTNRYRRPAFQCGVGKGMSVEFVALDREECVAR